MPELIEVEQYRRALEPLIGATVHDVDLIDLAYQRPPDAPPELLDGLVGGRISGTARIGKLLLVSVALRGETLELGLRFGMTGRLLIDGSGPIDVLEYSSDRNDPSWDRFAMTIGSSRVSIRDPRRLGSVELDPDVSILGPDASTLTLDQFAEATAGRTKAIKAILLDQRNRCWARKPHR